MRRLARLKWCTRAGALLCAAALVACAPAEPPASTAGEGVFGPTTSAAFRGLHIEQSLDGGVQATWRVADVRRRKRAAGLFTYENYSELVMINTALELEIAPGPACADPLGALQQAFIRMADSLRDGMAAASWAQSELEATESGDTVSRVVFEGLHVDARCAAVSVAELRAGLGRTPAAADAIVFAGPVTIEMNGVTLEGVDAAWLLPERALFFPGAHKRDGQPVESARSYRPDGRGSLIASTDAPDPARYDDPFDRFEQRMFGELQRRAGPTLAFMLMQTVAGQQEAPPG